MDHNEHRRRFLACFSSFGLSSTLLPGVLWAQVQQRAAPRVTREMLRDAERLAGLEFTDAQRDLLLDDVNQNLRRYDALRKLPLANHVPCSLQFSPVVSGMQFDTVTRPVRMSRPRAVRRPARLEDAAFWPVTSLAQLLKTRQATSVELAAMYLERLRRYDPLLHFVITLTPDLAMEQAQRADREIAAGRYRGPLHGIPWGAKDLIAKKGYKTTWGAAPFRDQSFDEDATVVQRLEEAGAVLVAKLSTGELAGGDRWFGGQTKNPWNPEEGSGGSSAGPASATAAGCVGFAVGTETGGSIVGPSTRCCVYGLRPTYGRVSRHGVMTLAWSLDKIGPICRSVEDCALVLHALAGPDGKDLTVTSVPFNWDATADIRKLRVGYVKAAFDEARTVSEEQANDRATFEKLREMGVELRPIAFPDLPIADIMRVLEVEFAAAFDDLTRSHRDDLLVRQGKGSDANLYRAGRFVPAVEYIEATRARMLLMEAMERTLAEIDVYLAPISAMQARTPGSLVNLNTTLTNLTGHPGVVVRNGVNSDGRPTSISFIGRIYGEAQMLALAHAYQTATDWHLRHPILI